MSTASECNLPTLEELVGARVSAMIERAEAICRLEPGWDHGDALAIPAEIAAEAVRLASGVTCPECLTPTLSPTPEGHILLDWTFGEDHVEIDVGEHGRLDVLVSVAGTDGEFVADAANDAHLRWIAWQVTGIGVDRFHPPS